MLRWWHLPCEQWVQGINRVANMHFKGPAHPCYRCFPLLWLIGVLLRALWSCKTALARHLSDSVRFGAPVRTGQITAHVILSLVAWALNLRRCPISLVNWEQLCGSSKHVLLVVHMLTKLKCTGPIWFGSQDILHQRGHIPNWMFCAERFRTKNHLLHSRPVYNKLVIRWVDEDCPIWNVAEETLKRVQDWSQLTISRNPLCVPGSDESNWASWKLSRTCESHQVLTFRWLLITENAT